MTVRVNHPGFRTSVFDVLTTLSDQKLYSATALADLYYQRWQAELYLRNIKTVLGMDHLKCKTPEMVRREIYMHIIAYNTIRIQMAEAAHLTGILPQQISFTSSLRAVLQSLTKQTPMSDIEQATMYATMARRRVGKQPGRIEPRAVKKRSPHPLLTVPRAEARTRLIKNDLQLSP